MVRLHEGGRQDAQAKPYRLRGPGQWVSEWGIFDVNSISRPRAIKYDAENMLRRKLHYSKGKI